MSTPERLGGARELAYPTVPGDAGEALGTIPGVLCDSLFSDFMST